jgi:hypothetical protein
MKRSLEEQKYELIRAHVLQPEQSPLNEEQKELLDRIVSLSKVLDKNPIQKHAVAVHMAKYPQISRTQAYQDLRFAARMFNTFYTFDYDMWQTWIINDIVSNILECRKKDTHQDRKTIAQEHANLIRAIGEKPENQPDPLRNEKHQFYILVNVRNETLKVDLNNLHKLPAETLQELNRALFAGGEITEDQAAEIITS